MKIFALASALFLTAAAAAQNVGIGTSSPVAALHVADSNVLFTGPVSFVNYNPPQLPPVQGPGTRLMWYPQKGAFRAGWVEDNRWNKDSIGIFSMAFGHSTLASNTGAVAFGVRTNAKGFSSTAFGWGSSADADYGIAAGYFNRATAPNTVALGTESLAAAYYSTAIGIHAVATGNGSVAIGDSSVASGTQAVATGSYVIAKARASFASGWFNDNSDSPDPNFIAPTDRLFQVGNGNGFLGTRSNALTILRNANTGIGIPDPRFPLSFNAANGDKISIYDDGNPAQLHFGFGISSGQLMQIHTPTSFDDIAFGIGKSSAFTERVRIKGNGKVGINTSLPAAHLHVADSNVVFTGPATIPVTTTYYPALQGAGTRMLWYPQKAAFRTGTVDGVQWDKDNIGTYSFAAGFNSQATGEGSFAAGVTSNATGSNSTAMGQIATASGDRSIAMGYVTTASGFASSAIGFGATASGNYAHTMGNNTLSSGGASFTIGDHAVSAFNNALSIGIYTQTTSDNSTAMGHYNDISTNNKLFEIGSGSSPSIRSNAFTILKNNNAGIGTIAPLARLHVDSSVLFTTSNILPASPAQTPVTGSGNRTFWYADKAAFRTGSVSNNSWDRDNIGVNSFAAGFSTHAAGITSFAMGNFAFATGDISTAIGNSVFAKAKMAASFGTYNDITDNPNPAVEAASDRLFQIGNGSGNLSRANAVTVLRNGNMGIGTINPSNKTEIIGAASINPVTVVIGNRGAFGPAALELVSDYGLANQWRPGYIRSNDVGSFTGALEFYTNGTGFANLYGSVKGLEVRNGATLTATGSVGSFSDARLKKDITRFTDGLNVISRINPVQFTYTENAPFKTSDRQVGIIAQELEKIAPYMVHQATEKEMTDLRWVDNQAYIFLLINSVKELQQQLSVQQQQIDQLLKLVKQ